MALWHKSLLGKMELGGSGVLETIITVGNWWLCGLGTWLRKRELVALWSRYPAEDEGIVALWSKYLGEEQRTRGAVV